MKTKIEKVVQDLTEMFDLNKGNEFGSQVVDRKFLINKKQFERFEVIEMLQEYFSDKIIDGGYLEVSSITFVFTAFEVKTGRP